MSRAAQTAPWLLSALLAGVLIGIVATSWYSRRDEPAPVVLRSPEPETASARGLPDATPAPEPGPTPEPGTRPAPAADLPERVRLQVALDGDSLLLEDGRQVRLIGIDTPEQGEPYADESRTWAKDLLDGKEVRLEYDEEKRDKYERLLAYVHVDAGGEGEMFVNAELVRLGYARSYPHRPNERHKATFTSLQKEAREAGRGIWSLLDTAAGGEVIGSTSRYHRPDCRHVSDIKSPHRFATVAEAMDAGLSACRGCKP